MIIEPAFVLGSSGTCLVAGLARADDDVLLAVRHVRRRRGLDRRAGGVVPEHVARLGVEGVEVAVELAAEHQAGVGGERAAHAGQREVLAPLELAGADVDRAHPAGVGSRELRKRAAQIELSREVGRVAGTLPDPALVDAGHVERVGLGRVAAAVELHPAVGVGAGQVAGPAGLGVLALLRADHQLVDDVAVAGVEHPEVAGLVARRDQRAVRAADLAVEQDGRHRGIPVVRVVREELVVPLELGLGAGDVERDHGVGVEVRALAHGAQEIGLRVTQIGVERVAARVDRDARPERRAAALPRVARPGVVAGLARARDRLPLPHALAASRRRTR